MSLVCLLDPDDPGQTALVAAGQSDSNFPFKIQFDDAPVGGTPSIRYFIGLVMGTPEIYETSNVHKKMAATIEINSNIVRVARAEDD